jgi:hypothetical protein
MNSNNNNIQIYKIESDDDVATARSKLEQSTSDVIEQVRSKRIYEILQGVQFCCDLEVSTDKIPIKAVNGKLSLKDNFDITEFLVKLNTKQYENTVHILNDLKRLFVILSSNGNYLLERKIINFDGQTVKYLETINDAGVEPDLLNLPTPFAKITSKNSLFYLFQSNKQCFHKQGYHFNSTLPAVQSVFEGWNYQILADPDYSIIQQYLDHIKKYNCNSDDMIYQYVLKWLAYIIKYPGMKIRTAIVMIGSQGCGKNATTD